MQLETLEKAAIAAGDHALALRLGGNLKTHEKEDGAGADWATQADDKCQAQIEEILSAAEPSEVLVGEEKAGTTGPLPDNGNCIVFDPIDATTLYYNGQDYPWLAGREFGVTLCVIRNGRPVQGVIYFPFDHTLFSAERGKGVKVVQMSRDGLYYLLPHLPDLGTWYHPIKKTLIGSDFGPWTVQMVANSLMGEEKTSLRSAMSAIYGARAVLTKETAAYYNFNIAKVWDAAAGVLMVEEQGGFACDPWGEPLKFTTIQCDWIIAANREMAEVILKHSRQWPGRAKK